MLASRSEFHWFGWWGGRRVGSRRRGRRRRALAKRCFSLFNNLLSFSFCFFNDCSSCMLSLTINFLNFNLCFSFDFFSFSFLNLNVFSHICFLSFNASFHVHEVTLSFFKSLFGFCDHLFSFSSSIINNFLSCLSTLIATVFLSQDWSANVLIWWWITAWPKTIIIDTIVILANDPNGFVVVVGFKTASHQRCAFCKYLDTFFSSSILFLQGTIFECNPIKEVTLIVPLSCNTCS